MKDLTKGNPLKLILLFALPLFIGQIFQLFYSLVDTRIVGETLGEASLAAVGASSSLSDLLIGFLNGLTNGFAIIIATYFGAKDEENLRKSIANTIILGVVTAIIITAAALIFLHPLLRFLNTPEDIMEQAVSYIGVIILGLMASMLYNVSSGILRAIGDTVTPLIFLIISAFLNIFLDYALILYAHMGVRGAAVATVLSQILSAVLCFLYMTKKYPLLRLRREDICFSPILAKRLFSSGMSMGLMYSFVSIGTVALQTSINTFGTYTIVAHTAARKVTSIFMLPFSVFGATLATYSGQNLGAGEISRIKEGIKQTLYVCFLWCFFTIIANYAAAPQMIRMITASNVPEIIQTATRYLRFDTLFYFVTAVICVFRNTMMGIGDHKTPIFSSGIELVGKVLVVLFLAPAIGYLGIIVAEPIVWFLMVIPLIVQLKRNPLFNQTTHTL